MATQQSIPTCNIIIDKFKSSFIIVFQTLLLPDYCSHAHNALTAFNQNASIICYVDTMKWHNQKIAGMTNYNMLDQFVQGVTLVVQCKVLKDNLSTFLGMCMIAERTSQLYDLLG